MRIYDALRRRWLEFGALDTAFIGTLAPGLRALAVECAGTVPALSNWRTYTALLREARAVRSAQSIGLRLAAEGLGLEDIRRMADELCLSLGGAARAESTDMKAGMLRFMAQMQKPRAYVKTGFARLDSYTYLDQGDYVVIGGRPSSGKTAFSLCLAVNMARAGRRVAYFSLETGADKIMDRIVTACCGLDFGRVKRQTLGDDWALVAKQSDAIGRLPIEIIPASGKSAGWMQSECLRRGAQVAVVDYLGLVAAEGASRYEKATAVSLALHGMAQQAGVLVIALSQLSRAGAGRAPGLEDLRESGQIEQDADVVLLLHNDREAGALRVGIAKNKEGEIGDILMEFDGKRQRIRERG